MSFRKCHNSMESLVAMVIVLSYQVWQISPFCLVAKQLSIITSNLPSIFKDKCFISSFNYE